MKAAVGRITARTQSTPVEARNIDQFTISQTAEVGAEIVLEQNWSLYCLDLESQRALFVETQDGRELSQAPFLYAEQFGSAERAALVDIKHLSKLATEVVMPENLAILMSTGRCGSTLASQMFSKVPGVLSLSEPDWATNLAFGRQRINDSDLQRLIKDCTRLTCHLADPDKQHTVVIKPRSEMMIQAGAYVEALKNANGIFLYRDCHGYVNSLYRFAQTVLGVKDPQRGSAEWNMVRDFSTIGAGEALLDDHFAEDETIEVLDLMTLSWTLRMQAYLNATNAGMRVFPIHYHDLNTDRVHTTRVLLERCGIPDRQLSAAISAFKVHSQTNAAGMSPKISDPITQAQVQRVSDLLRRWGWTNYEKERLTPKGRD